MPKTAKPSPDFADDPPEIHIPDAVVEHVADDHDWPTNFIENDADDHWSLDLLSDDSPNRPRDDAGQATVEYALVLLGAALVALLLIGWATVGGGGARIGQFLGRVFDVIERKVV